MGFFRAGIVVALGVICLSPMAQSQPVSPLFARGYTVVPEPQKVALKAGDLTFDVGWHLDLDSSVPSTDVAVESLTDDLWERFRVKLGSGRAVGHQLSLRIRPGSVQPGPVVGENKQAIADDAYRITLTPASIQIEANAKPGLFYGVETLVQLLKVDGNSLRLPEGSIEDWPDLHLRHIYWDDAHHLEHLSELQRAIRQAAFYKINGFTVKLEGHFQFKSAPALVEPYALTPAEYQELTDYGLRYHVQLIPFLDGPAHIAFILKHPEYAKLREYPESNYELCSTNPGSYKLLEGMFQDLIAANKGGKYFYLSTDEPYYIGLANNSQCTEAERAKQLGSVGKLFAEFAAKAGGYLHDKGRTVMFWGEYPMKVDDLPHLPSFLINGEVYGHAFDTVYKKLGIRQMIYTSSEGEEKLFPDYFILPTNRRLHNAYSGTPRVQGNFEKISFDSSRKDSALIGEINAGWADMGLHPETFWLGYIAASSAAWHPASPDPRETMSAFYPLFYGPHITNMDRVYQLMSEQAQFWNDSWDRTISKARKPIWGNSYEIYNPPRPADDETLDLPPVPAGDLAYQSDWSEQNGLRVRLSGESMRDNDELVGLLNENMQRAQFNRYNLNVFLSIAQLCRQNLEMIQGISHIDKALASAARKASGDPKHALEDVDRALDIASSIWHDRNQVLKDAETVWYQSWNPRVPEANGRKFLHELDDVKDHLPDRTVDMSYLVYRETLIPFGDWVKAIEAARNKFAVAHNLPAKKWQIAWDDLTATDRATR